MPGAELETLVCELVTKHLKAPELRANIVPDASTDELAAIDKRLADTVEMSQGSGEELHRALLATVGRVDIAPGDIKIALLPLEIAEVLAVDPERVSLEVLSIASHFRHRKRGVETKLILENAAAPRDETLFRNIALAHHYFGMIRAGKTYSEIAEAEGASKRRIQQLVELAFLAPDVIREVFEVQQPTGMASEWLVRHSFPPIWQEQREMFRAL